jgi:ubiquinone/menaquinone biosynthesis C-methylase UbiE
MKTKASKGYRGMGMEGMIARWYAKGRRNEMADFRQQAESVAHELQGGADVLEVAPGPGLFSIELAKIGLNGGNFNITGLDISQTFVEMAAASATEAGVKVNFQLGNACEMTFEGDSFDFIYCSAAFKNFSEPVGALNEMHRVLRPGGHARIVDLKKDVSLAEVKAYLRQSGRNRWDGWVTGQIFKHVLVKRAYTRADFLRMFGESHFHGCEVKEGPIGYEVNFTKPAEVAVLA